MAFGTVSVEVAPAPRSSARPVSAATVTPAATSQAAPLSEVIAPLPETAVIRTGKPFGLLMRSFRSAVEPGTRPAVVNPDASASTSEVTPLALAVPEPFPVMLQAAAAVPTASRAVAARTSRRWTLGRCNGCSSVV